MDAMAQVSEPKVEAIPELDSAVKLTVDVTLPAHEPCQILSLNAKQRAKPRCGACVHWKRQGSGARGLGGRCIPALSHTHGHWTGI
jgi:hypothetical protein